MNIDFPSITGTGDTALEQIKTYLFRLSEQLNYELNNLDRTVEVVQTQQSETAAAVAEKTEKTPLAQFDALKSLIINSAEIVNAYTEEINKTLSGQYVAKYEYDTFKEDTQASLSADSTRIDQLYTNVQTITNELTGDGSTLVVNGRIRSGLLENTTPPVYGVEVGQTTNINGQEVFRGYARFTADRLSFYDGDVEVAYLSNNKLYITNAEILSTLKIGGYRISASSGLAFNWVG